MAQVLAKHRVRVTSIYEFSDPRLVEWFSDLELLITLDCRSVAEIVGACPALGGGLGVAISDAIPWSVMAGHPLTSFGHFVRPGGLDSRRNEESRPPSALRLCARLGAALCVTNRGSSGEARTALWHVLESVKGCLPRSVQTIGRRGGPRSRPRPSICGAWTCALLLWTTPRSQRMSTPTPKETLTMELATAHVLTALYALAHRIALTPEELALLDERGRALTPERWRETKDTLRLADRGGAGTELDLGFVPLVLEWLGLADTRAFADRYAVDIDEALSRDRGSLAALAASIESGLDQPHEHFQLALSHAWSARAGRLMDVLPGTGEAVLLTLERALDGCPWDPSWLRPLGEAIVDVADRMGDEERAKAARRLLETIDREEASEEHQPFLLTAATQILTALWCLTHDGFVLEENRSLSPQSSPLGQPGAGSSLPFTRNASRISRSRTSSFLPGARRRRPTRRRSATASRRAPANFPR